MMLNAMMDLIWKQNAVKNIMGTIGKIGINIMHYFFNGKFSEFNNCTVVNLIKIPIHS